MTPMIYLRDKETGYGKRKKIAIGLLLFVGVLLSRHMASGALLSVATPLWRAEDWISHAFDPLTALWADKTVLMEENVNLEKELSDSHAEVQILEKNLAAHTTLSDLFASSTGAVARVLSRPPESPFDTLIVGLPKNSFISRGDTVYASGNSALGTVQEVYSGTGRINLYSAPGNQVSAFITGLGPITLTGMGNGNFIGEFPKDQKIDSGTGVTLAGKNVTVALIGTTTSAEGDQLQKIYARIPIALQKLTWVRIEHQE